MITEKQTKRMKRPTRLDPYLEALLKDPRFLKIVDDILVRPCCSFKTIGEFQSFVTHKVKPQQFTDNAFQLMKDLSEMDGQTTEGLEEMMYRITNDYLSYAALYLLSGVMIGVLFAGPKAQARQDVAETPQK